MLHTQDLEELFREYLDGLLPGEVNFEDEGDKIRMADDLAKLIYKKVGLAIEELEGELFDTKNELADVLIESDEYADKLNEIRKILEG